jgi:LemA protein
MAFRMKTILTLIIGFLFLIALWVWSGYNSLVTMQETVKNSWAQVETTYQRRVDLIPNLVSTVKGDATFEQSTLQAVTEARTKWMAAPDRGAKLEAAQGAESAISRLLVTMEAYPQLQATQAFRDLMAQLEGTENRINVARRDYNDAVMKYNVGVRQFPRTILAGIFGFGQEKPFEAAPGSENAPVVDFTK